MTQPSATGGSAGQLKLPADATLLATGIGFTEAPIVESESTVLVTSISRGLIYRVRLDGGGSEVLAEPGGGPNGLALDREGNLWVAQNGGATTPSRSLRSVGPSIQLVRGGEVSDVFSDGLLHPSDCVVGMDGALWFTDPADHRLDGTSGAGALRRFDPETGACGTLIADLRFPNGLAFGLDPGELYIAETSTQTVRRFEVHRDKAEATTWCVETAPSRPDGIAIDSEGWLWVAGSTGDDITAYDRSGRRRERLSFGTGVLVTSLCFAGPGLSRLVVTIAKGGTVVDLPALHPGLPLPIWR